MPSTTSNNGSAPTVRYMTAGIYNTTHRGRGRAASMSRMEHTEQFPDRAALRASVLDDFFSAESLDATMFSASRLQSHCICAEIDARKTTVYRHSTTANDIGNKPAEIAEGSSYARKAKAGHVQEVNPPKTQRIVFNLPSEADNPKFPRCGRSRLLKPNAFEATSHLPPLDIKSRSGRKPTSDPATAAATEPAKTAWPAQPKQNGGKPNHGRIQRNIAAKSRLLNVPAPAPEVTSQSDFPPLPTPAGLLAGIPGPPKITQIKGMTLKPAPRLKVPAPPKATQGERVTPTPPRRSVVMMISDLNGPKPEAEIKEIPRTRTAPKKTASQMFRGNKWDS